MAGFAEQDFIDRDRLMKLMWMVRNFLVWFITDTNYIEEDRELFRNVAFAAAERIDRAAKLIAEIEDTADPIWRRLDEAGLLGDSLQLKRSTGRRIGAATREEPANGRLFAPLLKWLNSLLGSLSTVFPPLELARELKDMTELSVPPDRSGPQPPASFIDALA